MAGTSRLSRFTNNFHKLGFISWNGQSQVHHSLLNVVLHDNPAIRGGKDEANFLTEQF